MLVELCLSQIRSQYSLAWRQLTANSYTEKTALQTQLSAGRFFFATLM